MTWPISYEKLSKHQNLINLAHSAPTEHLKILQQPMGEGESIAQMTPFAKSSLWPLLNFIKQFNNDEDVILSIPKSVQKDMQVWAAIAPQPPARASP
jgi:hypothetical protein